MTLLVVAVDFDVGSAAVDAHRCEPASEPVGQSDREVVELTEPAEGVPPVVTDAAALRVAATALAAGTGPIAVDTERASGYRYSARAYLVQLRREGAGTVLVDPIPLRGRLAPLIDAIGGQDWVLHAASQDLPCLAELELRPGTLFDTELAGRLAGYPRVALGALVEQQLGFRLEKGHGAADWSRRPLPADWLNYAALDVELLLQLRESLKAELRSQGKLEWALQEFEAVRTAPPPAPRPEPWRRTSGIHRMHAPRKLATVRALWQARDELARTKDIAPGRVLPDKAIIEAAQTQPADEAALVALPIFGGRAQRRRADVWMTALRTAAALPNSELPSSSPANDGPPPPNRWADRDPEAAARLTSARASLTELAEHHSLPVENLLQPDLLRRTCWTPPADRSVEGTSAALRAGGARPWQVELTAAKVSEALAATP
ncbi:HRDC domain-containing protein [Actinoalloteichus hymeniacidonis]|uniref:Ribonuclease D n=1 Tax=Actinoalloteichus hymeniacidonis TaxID=340345 RepID=A0AAC9HUS8_9PSEU|nr:ribonuclease D [Actinoalloteichus hymeniacidonis]AOS64910.1 ribonuclease D [Actinoalloteichus hymeniacidonis]MBB5907015.1 ribonuclease D [Actinoalloteichus hymeniacidonis]